MRRDRMFNALDLGRFTGLLSLAKPWAGRASPRALNCPVEASDGWFHGDRYWSIYLAFGVILVAMAVPLIRSARCRRTPFYGFRVRQTLADPAVWYEANAFAGRGMVVAGLAVVSRVGSLALYRITHAFRGPGVARSACLILVVISLGTAVASSFWYLGRIRSIRGQNGNRASTGLAARSDEEPGSGGRRRPR